MPLVQLLVDPSHDSAPQLPPMGAKLAQTPHWSSEFGLAIVPLVSQTPPEHCNDDPHGDPSASVPRKLQSSDELQVDVDDLTALAQVLTWLAKLLVPCAFAMASHSFRNAERSLGSSPKAKPRVEVEHCERYASSASK